jgi:DNA polymerase III delta subunit
LIYFIHGPDRFLARDAARNIASRLDPDGLNTSWIDGRESSLESVISAIGAASFFGGPRVVAVTDFLARSLRDTASDVPETSSDERTGKGDPALTTLLAAVPDDHHLILIEPNLVAPPSILKSLAPAATIVAAEPPRGAALISWIEKAALRLGAKIDRRATQALAETLYPQTWNRKPNNPRFDRPPDMARLTQEIEKLAAAAHPRPITVDLITALVSSGPDQRIFRFLDAVLNGDLRTSTMELDRLEAAGEEPAMVLAQVLGQVELAAVAAAAGDRDAVTISRDLGSVSASRVSAVIAGAKRQNLHEIGAIDAATSADRRLKTGRVRRPEAALQEFIYSMALLHTDQKTSRSE